MNQSLEQRIPHKTVSSIFYTEFVNLIVEYVGEEILEHFKSIKSQQERYLNSHWDEISGEEGFHSIRKIDYTFLLGIVRSRLSSQPDALLDFHLRAASLCLQYGKKQTADKMLDSISVLNKERIRKHYLSGPGAIG